MNRTKKLLAVMTFLSSFTTGALAMVIGSEIGELIKLYNRPLETVVFFSSAMALGRIIACTFVGKVVNKIGAVKGLLLGNICAATQILLLTIIPNYYLGMLFAFLGGVGMAFNDNSSPIIVGYVFPDKYSSMLSAGQTMYCFGNFALTLLLSLFLKINVNFYFANVICSIAILITVICGIICFNVDTRSESEEESIQPIYTKRPRMTVVITALGSFTYCAVCCCVGLYTTQYLESIGMSTFDSSFLLTVYNVGSTIGSILFIFILRKISERAAFVINACVSLAAMLLALVINTYTSYLIGLFIAGTFLGVIFALVLAIATRIYYKKPTEASSLIGVAGGLGDICIPFITSNILTTRGIAAAYKTSIFFMIMTLCVAVAVFLLTKEKKDA